MISILRKTLLTGIGAAVITTEKAEAAFADYVENGKLSAADARDMARKLARDGRNEFNSVSRELEVKIKDFVARADLATKTRVAELEARIAELEKTRARPARSKPGARSK